MPAKFTMRFTLDNAAFDDDYANTAADVIRLVGTKVRDGGTGGNIRDINGNTIGTWKLR